MSSNTEYSQTLQHITDAKLAELSNKREIFLQRKAAALGKEQALDSPLERLHALANGVKTCFDIRVKDDGRVVGDRSADDQLEITLANLDRFLKQAQYDPSISAQTLERWRQSLLRILDVQTIKYEYATLFAQLTMEWLSVKKRRSSGTTRPDDFEAIPSTEKMESRRRWEKHVFTPTDRDQDAIKAFLSDLFTRPIDGVMDNSKDVTKALGTLRKTVAEFEAWLARPSQFDVKTLGWVISGLLSSDLPTEKQRAVLREFQNDRTVLSELADVLNMRLASLHSWSWGPEVAVEQRRQLNGAYQIYMHEDLIQAIFLQYLGVRWSVFFKSALGAFRKTRDVWKSPRSRVPDVDKKRRGFFLNEQQYSNQSLQMTRECIYRSAYFVSQLLDRASQQRRQEEGEVEASYDNPVPKRRKQTVPQQVQMAARQIQQAPMTLQYQRMPQNIVGDVRFSSGVKESDDDGEFHIYDSDNRFDPDQMYDDHYAQSLKKPANQMQAKQNLLLLLGADIRITKRLYGEITCFRTQYESLYPSLPHPTVLGVLSFLGVSEKWITFFQKFLAAPLKFIDDDAEPRLRRRGIPGSHVLSEVFGEVTLFCLDFMVNKETAGEILWRVNDDLWFWSRSQETCLTAWSAIQRFNEIMGLPLSEAKTGGVHMTIDSETEINSDLPTGKIRWGMLYLNPNSGCFEIDQEMVNGNIQELGRQLRDKQDSVFSWIQAWNSYASTFFTYNFGTPANCFGKRHVDMMLQTHQRIQREIFSSAASPGDDNSVVTYLRDTIRSRFGIESIPDGYFFLPIDLGGLELSSPFITLVGLRDSVLSNPDSVLDNFFEAERDRYNRLARQYLARDQNAQARAASQYTGYFPTDAQNFMSFEEYTRHRELLDYGFHGQLVHVYDELLQRPSQEIIGYGFTGPIAHGLKQLEGQTNLSGIKSDWDKMSAYWRWVAQLYGPEIVERFGGFNVVDPGLLPIGLISQFRSGRVSWREE